jgi:hypothetical protein
MPSSSSVSAWGGLEQAGVASNRSSASFDAHQQPSACPTRHACVTGTALRTNGSGPLKGERSPWKSSRLQRPTLCPAQRFAHLPQVALNFRDSTIDRLQVHEEGADMDGALGRWRRNAAEAFEAGRSAADADAAGAAGRGGRPKVTGRHDRRGRRDAGGAKGAGQQGAVARGGGAGVYAGGSSGRSVLRLREALM